VAGSSTGAVELRPSWDADAALTAAAAAGDQRARAALVERLLDRVRRTTSYMSVSRDDVDDLAQIALMEVLRSAGSFRGESSVESWADRITARVAVQHLRKGERRRGIFARFLPSAPTPPPIQTPDEAIAERQVRSRVAHCLTGLTPERRAALVLRHVHGYAIDEIAEMTETPVNTVRDRLRVARKQLRKRALADPLLREWACAEGGSP
jgi:RNA polymerase sigma factor (sigma-70 family)